jgi:Patatin-like phospholipase
MHLTGLAFSGGGIRSGTFAVGFLQGLASLGLLQRLDYLSTVSGGGYAAGWLAAWLAREADVANVERQLALSRVTESRAWRHYLHEPSTQEPKPPVVDEEPEPLHHLREYSSYLAPRFGLFTADTWSIVMIWIRNLSINLMMLFPAAMLLVLLARAIVYVYGTVTHTLLEEGDDSRLFTITCLAFVVLGLLVLAIAFSINAIALQEFRRRGQEPRVRPGWIEPRIDRSITLPTLLAALLLTSFLPSVLWVFGNWLQERLMGTGTPRSALAESLSLWVGGHLGLLGLPNILLHILLFGGGMALGAALVSLSAGSFRWKFVGCALMAGGSGGVLFAVVESVLGWLTSLERPDLLATFAVPSALAAVIAAVIVEVALLGPAITEAEREWWARFNALLGLAAAFWIITFGTILYVPVAFLRVDVGVRMVLASGWLGTTAAGVLASRRIVSRSTGTRGWLPTVALVAPPVFVLGLVGAVALLVAYLVNDPAVSFSADGSAAHRIAVYLQGVKGASWVPLVLYGLLMLFLYRLASDLIDVNRFSLHAMYANRLIRGYLGASRAKQNWRQRWGTSRHRDVIAGAPTLVELARGDESLARDENPVTGFDPDDDLPLIALRSPAEPTDPRGYWGPLPLINTTLNLVGGSELAWRDRKGESFVLSPLYCGAKETGYAQVPPEAPLTLGRAMTISGAAIDPNMGFLQSPMLTAFLTLFNARLGYWIENPNRAGWTAASPCHSARLLWDELFGRTVATSPSVHLSDGGHFENLGVYELVRRRCRYIIALDAGEDADPSDDNLATLIRLCRIDFGVRIQVDTAPLRMIGDDRLTATHVVIGTVRYDDVDNGQRPGVLVYIKISLTGDEPPDVQKYARKDPRFPHQATDFRQSFDEEQFESYRALGDHIARDVFEDAVRQLEPQQPLWSEATWEEEFIRGNQHLFGAVRRRWAEPPAAPDARPRGATAAWLQLRRDLRTDPALAPLSRELYPELAPDGADVATAPPAVSNRAGLHAVGQMLQIMEDTWIGLGRKGHADLPMDQNWLNVFRRWSSSATFRRFWPVYRAEFSPDFVEFCETVIHLNAADPATIGLDDVLSAPELGRKVLDLLAAEFDQEWPDEANPGRGVRPSARRKKRGLNELIERAKALDLPMPPVWLIVQAPSGPPTAAASHEKFLGGIILAADYLDEQDQAVADHFEFFVWVRPPHRSIGLGTRCVPPKLREVGRLLSQKGADQAPFLRARYPVAGRGAEGDFNRSRWLEFFDAYDFKALDQPDDAPWTVLELPVSRRGPGQRDRDEWIGVPPGIEGRASAPRA